MIAFAPGRLSTATCWWVVSVRLCAMTRAIASLGPAAENGTISRIGFVGKAPCSASAARADPATETHDAAAATSIQPNALLTRARDTTPHTRVFVTSRASGGP